MNMKFKLSLILLILLFPFATRSQQTNQLKATIEAQNSRIQKLDSTITHLKNENAHLKELAEQDIDHAKSLISTTETIVEFIAVLLTIFTLVGGFVIAKMFRQSSQINKDHKVLLEDWEKTRKEIENLKESSMKEGKELLQILFYITEGDNKLNDNPNEAVNLYEKALKIREYNPEVYAKLGYAYSRLGEYDKAIFQLEKGYKIAPSNLSILITLSRANRLLKRLEKASFYCKKALEIDENEIGALYELGRIALVSKDIENGEHIFKRLMFLRESDSWYRNLGIIYFIKKDKQKALFYFEKALLMTEKKLIQTPNNKDVIIQKIISLLGLCRFEEAENEFLKLKNCGLYPSQIRYITERLIIFNEILKNDKIERMINMLK